MKVTHRDNPIFESFARQHAAELLNIEHDIPDAEYAERLAEAKRSFPDHDGTWQEGWAIYTILTHSNRRFASGMAHTGASSDVQVKTAVEQAMKTETMQTFRKVSGQIEAQSATSADMVSKLTDHFTANRDHHGEMESATREVSKRIAFMDSSIKDSSDKVVGAMAQFETRLENRSVLLWQEVDKLAESFRPLRWERICEWIWKALLVAVLGAIALALFIRPAHAQGQDFVNANIRQFAGISLGSNYLDQTNHGLNVTCVSGCSGSGGTSVTDNSSFSVGTTAGTPAFAYYTSGTAPTLSTGNVGRIRMDSNSYLFTDCVVGCSGGAATPADAFTNPTTAGLSFSFNAGYNGTTWDLLRSGDKNNVVGVTGVLNTGPLGRYNATQPTLTDTRYNMLQLTSRGELLVGVGTTGFAVSGSGVFEVGPTTSANTLSNQFFTQLSDGTHGVGTNSTTYTSKYGLDINLLGTLGTAFSTAGYIDIKGADGNVFIRQTTAANLNATVVGTGTFATQSVVSQGTASNLNATVVGAGSAGSPSGGVVSIQGVGSGTAVPVSLSANQSVNVAQVNGVTTLTGTGATGTGSQRTTVAQDTNTIAGSAPGTAGTASAQVVTVQGVASMTPVQVSPTTSANSGSNPFFVQQVPVTGSGPANSVCLLTANTTAASCKGSAGNVYGWSVENPNATLCVLQFFNTSSVTLGTTQELLDIPVLGSGGNNIVLNFPIQFSSDIYVASTTAAHGASTCASGMLLNIFYQ